MIIDENDCECEPVNPLNFEWKWACRGNLTYFTDHRLMVRFEMPTRFVADKAPKTHIDPPERNPFDKDSSFQIVDALEFEDGWSPTPGHFDAYRIDGGIVVRIGNRVINMAYFNWLFQEFDGNWEWKCKDDDRLAPIWFRRRGLTCYRGTILVVLSPMDVSDEDLAAARGE